MKILSLDLATKTGWAHNVDDPFMSNSGTSEFPVKRGESPGIRFLRCRAWLNSMSEDLMGIDVIVYEQAHHRGGAATAVCVGLATEVQAFAAEQGIELMTVHTSKLKKFATGNGRASKEDMIKAAKRLGWAPADDNEADAIMLLYFAVTELGEEPKGEE